MSEAKRMEESEYAHMAEHDDEVKPIWSCPNCGGWTKNLYVNNQRLCVGFEDNGCGWIGKMRKNRKGQIKFK